MAKETQTPTQLLESAGRLFALAKNARAEGNIEFADQFDRLGTQALNRAIRAGKKPKKKSVHK